MNPSGLRLCFLADLNDIHSQKWIRYFCGESHEVHILSTTWWDGDYFGARVHNLGMKSDTQTQVQTRSGLSGLKKRLKRWIFSKPRLRETSLFCLQRRAKERNHVVTYLLARFGIGPHVNDTALPPIGARIVELIRGGEAVEDVCRSRKNAERDMGTPAARVRRSSCGMHRRRLAMPAPLSAAA